LGSNAVIVSIIAIAFAYLHITSAVSFIPLYLMKNGGQGAAIGTVLLFMVVAFMVTAGFPF
jgi:hypothetical protein